MIVQLGECLEKSQPVLHALPTILVKEKVLALKGFCGCFTRSPPSPFCVRIRFLTVHGVNPVRVLEVTSKNTLATLKVQPSLQLIHTQPFGPSICMV